MRPPLGLGALARVVDQERVDQRQVAERGVGAARRRHAQRLAGQPLQVAVLAEVHDGVGAETAVVVQPAVGGQVVVARAAGRGRGRSRPGSRRSPRGGWTISTTLPDCRAAMTISPSGSWLRSTNSSPGGGPQCSSTASASSAGSVANHVAVVRGGHPDRVAGQLLLGEPVLVLAAALDQRVDQRVAVAARRRRGCRRCRSRRRAWRAAARPRWPGCRGRPRCRCGRAWSGRPRTPARPACPRARCGAAGRAAPRARDPGAAFGVGDVGDQAVVVDLLERERDRDDPAVELRAPRPGWRRPAG